MNHKISDYGKTEVYTYEDLEYITNMSSSYVRKIVQDVPNIMVSKGNAHKHPQIWLSYSNWKSIYNRLISSVRNEYSVMGKKAYNFIASPLYNHFCNECKIEKQVELKRYDKYHTHYRLSNKPTQYLYIEPYQQVVKVKEICDDCVQVVGIGESPLNEKIDFCFLKTNLNFVEINPNGTGYQAYPKKSAIQSMELYKMRDKALRY